MNLFSSMLNFGFMNFSIMDIDLINKLYLIFIKEDRYLMILNGLGSTLSISVCAVLLGTVLGFLISLMKLTEERKGRRTVLSTIANWYIDIIRGTPSVVQLMIMYFLVFKGRFDFLTAVTTFAVNSSAYVAEIIRAGIQAVDKGQMEGGRSLGLNYVQTMRYIIVPQAIKNILPALGNEFIVLIKETAIVGYVSIQDLTKSFDFIISRTYTSFVPLISLAVIYFIIVKIVTKLLNILERRLRQSDTR